MASLIVRYLPDQMLESLKARASMNRRSPNGEILCVFDYVVFEKSAFDLIREARVHKQRESWRRSPAGGRGPEARMKSSARSKVIGCEG